MAKFHCVACDNTWDSKVTPTQCGKCRSYDVMEEKAFKKFLVEVKRLSPDHPMLRLQILREKIKADGLRFKPISTLNIVEKVLDDIFPRVPVGASITHNGRVLYHKKRVRRPLK